MLKRKNQFLAAAAISAIAPLGARAATVTFSYINVQVSTTSAFTVGVTTSTVTPVFDGSNWDITVPAGDFFRFGVRAAITSPDSNPAHTASGTPYEQGTGNTQPATLGLDSLAFQFTDSATASAFPVSNSGNSTAVVSTLFNASVNKGDVNPGNGSVGDNINNQLGGGVFSPDVTTATGKNQIQIGVNGTAGNNNIFTNLAYSRSGTASAKITPSIPSGTLSFIQNTSIGSPQGATPTTTPAVAPTYASRVPTGADTINTLAPLLVLGPVASGHAIISLTSSAGGVQSGYGAQITQGSGNNQGNFVPASGNNKLTVTGGSGSYTLAQVKAINGGTGVANDSVEGNGFNPATDTEEYALDVTGLGSTTPAALAALINGDPNKQAGTGMTASATYPGPGPNPFPAEYNLFLQFTAPPSADNFLGFDFTTANDSSLPAGLTVTEVALVPEPASAAGLLIGASGLLLGRRKRKA